MVTKATSQPTTCGSVEDIVVTNCLLTWNGITIHGTIDAGLTWRSLGAPLDGASAIGKIISSRTPGSSAEQPELVKHRDQGNSRRSAFRVLPAAQAIPRIVDLARR